MKPAQLITIRFSHYCDKARWGLERKGVPFTEVSHVPLVSSVAALSAGRNRTVPVLVTHEGTFTESQDILRYADRVGQGPSLFPKEHEADVDALCAEFDRRLGPAARRVAYFYLLDAPQSVKDLFRGASTGLERAASGLLASLFSPVIRRGLGVNPQKSKQSEQRLHEVFATVEAKLRDGRRYLMGDVFTAADLTFATLAAPVLMPPQYLQKSGAEGPVPENFCAAVDAFRGTKAGAFGMRLYAEDR